jgi:hypothetical protein
VPKPWVMKATAQTQNEKHEAGPRLVLISELEPAKAQSQPPVRIIGAEPRTGGGFRLTDR